jgi:hypothetical protein
MASIRDVLTAILDRRLSNPEDELLQTIQEGMSTPTWTAPTLLNSWVNFGSGWSEAGYYKDAFSRIHLRGLIHDGTMTVPVNLFTLPAGYRPSASLMFNVRASDSAENASAGARIDVAANGNVTLSAIDVAGAGTGGYLSLGGISFLAEQ